MAADEHAPASIASGATGVLVDRHKLVAARKSAMLERFELAELSGVSRDEIAKLENGERKRPRVVTMRKLIAAFNKARADRGKSPIDVEDLQDASEILISPGRHVLTAEDYAADAAG